MRPPVADVGPPVLALLGAVAVACGSPGDADRRDPSSAASGEGASRAAGSAPPAAADTGPPVARYSVYGADAPPVESADFVGAETCGECHGENYREWASSTHGNAGGEPASDTIIAPFGGDTIRFRDATVVPAVDDTGAYVFRVRWEGHGTRTLTVEGVVGKGHMVGGGNQGYFTRAEDGTYRFLPFDWSRTEQTWFCNTIGRRDRGWVPTTDLELADCSDWPPERVLGFVPRYDNCQECHGSQIRVDVQRGQPHFDTHYRSLRINCESCHGPGRRHVELARSDEIPGRSDIGLPALDTLDKFASVGVCVRCHALKTPLQDGYQPGKPFESHYALKLPILGGRPYYPDGRVRTFAYQGTHLSSMCFVSGSMTCTDCHAPHSGEYRDHVGRPVEGRFGNGQCTSCHPSKSGPALERHTHHPPSSEGSQCVRCHMPYLQQQELGARIRYARSDHSIPVPRPAFDDSLGLGSSCAECHDDRSAASLRETAESWWGPVKPQDPLVQGILEADSVEDLGRVGELLLQPDRENPVAQFEALSRLVENHLRPDMDSLPRSVRSRLERLAASSDLEIRAGALAALHYSLGRTPEVGRFLTARLGSGGAGGRRVRDRWAVALGFLGDKHRDAGETGAAISTYRKALEVQPDDADLHFALGRAYAYAGAGQQAIEQYRRTLELDPNRALAWVNMGIVHAARSRPQQAVEAYRSAMEINPQEPLAYFNLGNLHLRAGRPGQAADAYRRTLEVDPGLANAYFNHTRALIRLRRYAAALDTVQLGLEYRPEAETAQQMLMDLRRATGGSGP